MEIAGKSLNEYISMVKMPVMIAVAWTIINVVITFAVPLLGILTGLVGLIIGFGLPLWVGWTVVKNYGGNVSQGAVAGGVYGLIAGVIGGIITLLMLLVFPAASIASGGGAAAAAVGGFLFVAALIGIVIGTGVGVVLSAILSAIGAFAAQSMGGGSGGMTMKKGRK